MKAKNWLGLGSALLLVLALGLAGFCLYSARGAQANLTALAQKRAALGASLHATQERAAAREREEAALQAELTGRRARAAAAAAADSDSAAAAPKSPPASVATLLAADPKLMDLYLRSFRANLTTRFGALYEKYNLTAAQIAKFEDLATAHEGEIMDLQAAAEAQGLTASDPGIAALRQKSNQEFRSEVAEATGVSPAQLNQETVVATANQRNQGMVNSVAMLVAMSSTPISSAQAAQLAPIFEEATTKPVAGVPGGPPNVDWDKVTVQATGFLSGPQLQAVRLEASLFQVSGMVKQYYAQQPASSDAK